MRQKVTEIEKGERKPTEFKQVLREMMWSKASGESDQNRKIDTRRLGGAASGVTIV
jgi:hypothetical protein